MLRDLSLSPSLYRLVFLHLFFSPSIIHLLSHTLCFSFSAAFYRFVRSCFFPLVPFIPQSGSASSIISSFISLLYVMLFLPLNFWLYIRGLHDRPFALIISKARRRSHESIFCKTSFESSDKGQRDRKQKGSQRWTLLNVPRLYVFSARAVFHLRYLLSIILQTVKFVRTE